MTIFTMTKKSITSGTALKSRKPSWCRRKLKRKFDFEGFLKSVKKYLYTDEEYRNGGYERESEAWRDHVHRFHDSRLLQEFGPNFTPECVLRPIQYFNDVRDKYDILPTSDLGKILALERRVLLKRIRDKVARKIAYNGGIKFQDLKKEYITTITDSPIKDLSFS